jgi:2-C-methyl-D-erythritol 4-phosphate cytidylyltransferase / 2-C-methyl-D-erythritol 2,4-cyclodiphosphate synthase
MTVAAIVVAAGVGSRAGGAIPKQFRPFGGIPLLTWSLRALSAHAAVDRIVVAIRPQDEHYYREAAAGMEQCLCVQGGETRTLSVYNALREIAQRSPDAVLIHDAARPGLTGPVVDRLLAALESVDGTAPALPVVDALKRTNAGGAVIDSLSRERLWRIQTPQAFRFDAILSAYEQIKGAEAYDDDFAVGEAAGLRLRLVEGDERLRKITAPGDHEMMERMLSLAEAPCVGIGFDAHRFGPGDHVTLCGVALPHDAGLIGHSDADAAWHALTDAILGALGQGDIGDHFPPSDPQWRGAPSEVFLRHALTLAGRLGGRIIHVDLTILCERPKIKPHREIMRAKTADVLGMPLDRVSVKATTTERLGFLGREEGLAAQAVATVLMPGLKTNARSADEPS